MNFKVGDRVRRKIANSHWKAIFGEQTEGIVTYVNGDDILIDAKNQNGINDTSRFSAWSPDNFELVETETQQHTHTFDAQQYYMKYNTYTKQYEKKVVTPQEGENKMNKIVDLYESRRMFEINKNESMEIEKIKETESPLRKKIMKLKEDTEKELNKLYMSQFTKEQIKEFETVGILDTDGIEVIKRGNVTLGVDLSNDYKKEDIEKIEKQADVLRDELHTKVAEINAMLSIIPENETEKIMSVLVRYGVVTEQGNLTI